MIQIENLSKAFTLHNQGGAVIPVMSGAFLSVRPGECVGLTGPSGAGKSTLLRMVWGNYLVAGGSLVVDGLDVAPRLRARLLRFAARPWAMSASSCVWCRACPHWT